ncbi:MAG: CoA-transferase subunit beta [Actinomycetota bacterium]|nr:CoA-transferase [Actinomycetota bacterium]
MSSVADVCVAACADAWRGDGEILASAFGSVPLIGARLARLTFEPELLLSDGEAFLLANVPALSGAQEKIVEGWLPFASVFELLAAGRRHVMMMPSQIDRSGNMNISCVGDWSKPTRQLIGSRGGPGNTVNHPTSYWVPNHSTRSFVKHVDFVSGVGYDRPSGPFHEIRRVVTNLCVLDFETPDHSMRLRSLHPGVTVEHVVESTGFSLTIPGDVPATRTPTDDEMRAIESLDPSNLRGTEVKV